jgi:hypothetical protein
MPAETFLADFSLLKLFRKPEIKYAIENAGYKKIPSCYNDEYDQCRKKKPGRLRKIRPLHILR